MSKTELYLSKIVEYGLYAVLLTPLAFWPQAIFPFLTPKFVLFQTLVEMVFGAWLLLMICKGRLTKVVSNWRNNYIILALLGFFVVSFTSAVFGIDFSRSFWGVGARMTGLFAGLHFLAWFLVLTDVFADSVRRTETSLVRRTESIFASTYMNFSFAVSVLVALTAFYTNLTWRLVPGYTVFSNPTFVAPYFLFHFFWGLYQIWKNRPLNKLFSGAGSILILIALFLGEVRGAIIGLLAGILLLGIGLILSDIFRWRRRVTIAVLCLLLLLGVAVLWQRRDTSFVKSYDLLKKFSEISTTATTQTRILLWQTSLRGFFDRLLLGVGPENFNYLFNTHYDSRFLKYGGNSFDETWQDKPHNAFLEVLAELGIIGALVYTAIWLAAAFYLFKIFKSGQKLTALILSGALIAYLGAIFFSFDSFGSWFDVFLFLVFLASIHNNSGENSESQISKITNYSRLLSLAIILATFSLLYINYSIWRANLADADALRIFPRNPDQGINLFKESLSYLTPYKSEYQFDLVASIAGAIEKHLSLPNLEDNINFALDEADKAVASHPKDAAGYTDMTKIYNILGTIGRDSAILVQAETFGRKSLELSPNRQETLFYLARAAMLKNDPKLAVKLTQEAVSVDPDISLSHWYLGLSYIADNQRETGAAEIKRALEMGYQLQNDAEKRFIENLDL